MSIETIESLQWLLHVLFTLALCYQSFRLGCRIGRDYERERRSTDG